MSGWEFEPPRQADTAREPLPGAVGWPKDDDDSQLVADIIEASGGNLDEDTARYLAGSHGVLGMDVAVLAAARPELAERLVPGRPEVLACVEWAVTRELAATVDDVLQRRMPLFFKDLDQGLSCAETVADHLGAALGWDSARRERELERYRHEVALSRAWRDELA
jgi:glycerol-3-phosphate dehydrogenase